MTFSFSMEFGFSLDIIKTNYVFEHFELINIMCNLKDTHFR